MLAWGSAGGLGKVGVLASSSGLEAATTYKYRVLVADKSGRGEGVEQAFETSTPPPAERPSFGYGPVGSATGPVEALVEALVSPGESGNVVRASLWDRTLARARQDDSV